MKKALPTIKKAVVRLIVIYAVLMALFTIIAAAAFDQADRSIGGYKLLTDASSADIILVKQADPAALTTGDSIAYSQNNGETVIGSICGLTQDAYGNPGFITYDAAANRNDDVVVTYSSILGKYQLRLPCLGGLFRFLKTTQGYLICIALPFLLLILVLIFYSIHLLRRYRQLRTADTANNHERPKPAPPSDAISSPKEEPPILPEDAGEAVIREEDSASVAEDFVFALREKEMPTQAPLELNFDLDPDTVQEEPLSISLNIEELTPEEAAVQAPPKPENPKDPDILPSLEALMREFPNEAAAETNREERSL